MKVELHAAHVYSMAGSGVGYLGPSTIFIESGKITDIKPCKEQSLQGLQDLAAKKHIRAHKFWHKDTLHISCPYHAIFPGLIDAHMHSSCNILRGLAQDCQNWMMHGLAPFEQATKEEAKDKGAKLALIEGLKAGTTCFADFNANMKNSAAFMKDLGLRGLLAQTIRAAKYRVYESGELYELDEKQGQKSFREALEFFDTYHNKGALKVALGPQGIDFVGLELLEDIYAKAKELGTKVHMHVQQGDRETYQVQKRYSKRPVELLHEKGLLNERLIAVHLTDCDDEEAGLVAKSGAGMVVNPSSIAIIDGIICPSLAFSKAGGFVALGSDQACGNNRHNIIGEMKMAAFFSKIKAQNPEELPAYKALRMATCEGAKVLGLDHLIGSLETGKRADLIAINLKSTSMAPLYLKPMRNIVPNLVYSASGSEVELAMVDGKLLLWDFKVQGLDEDELFVGLDALAAQIGEEAQEEFDRINGKNSQYMREGCL